MKYGQRNLPLMSTLQQQKVFIQFNKLPTRHDACIDWLRYIGTSLTLQSSTKLRVKNMLKIAHLTLTENTPITTTNHKPITVKSPEYSWKHIFEINHETDNEWKEIVFFSFNLNMRSIFFGNSDKRIFTIAFEIRYHPDNSVVLKIIMSRISFNDKPSSDNHIYLDPYILIQ